MTQFTTVRDALNYLENLGDPDLIADDLYDSGIRAVPGCPDTCAIARYILRSVTVFNVVVDGDEVFGRYDDHHWSRFREVTRENVHAFIVNFDHGRYPALILPGSNPVDADDLEEVTP